MEEIHEVIYDNYLNKSKVNLPKRVPYEMQRGI